MAIAADSSSPTGPPSAADCLAVGVAAASETSVTAAAVVASAPVAVVAAADSIITRGIRCAGVEEVAAIDLLQRALSPRRAIAKLLALPGGGVVGNGGLRQRPRPEGVAREEDGEQVRQGEEAAGVAPSPEIPDAHAHDDFAIRRGDTMLDAWGAAISTSMRRPDKILQLVAAMDIPRP